MGVSVRGQPCKSFPHIQFDHYTKFGCFFFSYCVRAYRRFQNLRDAGARSIGMGT